eukprot:TRINITY_DN67677_c2_g3_i1.p1 TRINITY_DN67677_c2_g3~~TRINITY_DN67677_c2_g3_i1.p1  ORF type:complete len:478 (+),score=82.26 TRINITY_DN67677_c2_g3_i1:65-1498(+)
MLDILLFREDKGGNPDLVRESQRRRCKPVEIVDEVIAADKECRELTNQFDKLRGSVNSCSKMIGKKKKAKEADGEDKPIPEEILANLMTLKEDSLTELNVTQIKALSKAIDVEVQKLAALQGEAEAKRDNLLKGIGNIVHEDCLPTANEDENQTLREFALDTRRTQAKEKLLNHVDIMTKLKGMETGDLATNVAGGRAYFLMGDLVRLQLALVNYAMSFATQRGFCPIYPPFFMRKEAMAQVAQLSQFDEELYKVSGEGDDKYMIATSEQPLCAFFRNRWFSEKADLPIRLIGYSSCFRKEAGSHGRDTLGIFRVHQFDKMEQFCVTSNKEDASWKMMDEMIKNAEDFYQSLGIPYRVVRIVAGALNDAAAMKYDLEGWFPGAADGGTYRELVSCSNCTDYQARRVGTRLGAGGKGDKGPKQYAHMLNSTLCALTRVMCAICENYQTAEGVTVPEVLRPFMGGTEIMKYPAKDLVPK